MNGRQLSGNDNERGAGGGVINREKCNSSPLKVFRRIEILLEERSVLKIMYYKLTEKKECRYIQDFKLN